MTTARPHHSSDRAARRALLERTNVTGLASLRDYTATHSADARDLRDWIVAFTPVFDAMAIRSGEPVSGLPTVGIHPPDQRLPRAQVQDLQHMAEVVHATGTQILEMRNSGGPQAADFSVQGRMALVSWFLALGGIDGMAVRELVWVREDSRWHYSSRAQQLSRTMGMTRAEYQHFRQSPLHRWLPVAPDRPTAEAQARREPEERPIPWISFQRITDLLLGDDDPKIRSKPVRRGHQGT